MNVERVRWRDAHATGGWKTEAEMRESGMRPYLVDSVGFVFLEDDETVMLVQGQTPARGDPDEASYSSARFTDSIAIPKSTIVERRKLQEEA